LADRFAALSLGYGPAFHRKPFRPHLTVGALSCVDVLEGQIPNRAATGIMR